MNWQYVLVTLALFSAALVSTALALFAWLRRVTAWSTPFAVLMLAVAEWSLAYALELGATDLVVKLFWAQMQYVGIVVAPVAWFLFAVRYIGRERWLQRQHATILAVIPVLTLLLALTNGTHGLIWSQIDLDHNVPFVVLDPSYGLWFWVFAVYGNLLILGGSIFLYRALRLQYSPPYRWTWYVMLLGPLLPWLGNILFLTGVGPLSQVNLTPVGFATSGLIISWGILRHHLFDLVPVARQTVLDNMSDGVLVVNVQERIVDINPAGQRILAKAAESIVGASLTEALPDWAGYWRTVKEQGELDTEIAYDEETERIYNLRISPLYTADQQIGGHLIVLREITERKQAEADAIARQRLFANLVAVARATAEGPSLPATLQNALDVATALTRAEFGSVFLLDGDGRVTDSILARGKTRPGSQRQIVGRVMDKGLAGWVVRHRQMALVNDTIDDERWLTLPNQPYTARSVLVVPITSGPEVPGVLTLQHSRPHHFDETDAKLMQSASDQMALALRNAQIYETQRRLANRQSVLYHVLTRIGGHLQPDTVTHVAVETVASLTDWPAVAILVAQGEELVVQAATGQLASVEGKHLAADLGIPHLVYQSGETQVLRGPSLNKRSIGDLPRLRSALYVPLRHGNERLGIFAVESAEVEGFSDDDIWLAESLAEALALALANARLFKAVADEHSRLQALIEASRDGIILVGTNQKLLVINHTALTYIGLSGEPEKWTNRPLADALNHLRRKQPQLVRETMAEIRRSWQEEAGVAEGEFQLGGRALQWTSLPVMAGNKPVGWLIVLQDVTRERALQRMRDDLTHTMVHDLRNPLNVVSNSLEMLEERPAVRASAEVSQIVAIAWESTRRMLDLVNGILSISRLEAGHMPILRQPLDVGEVVETVLKEQRLVAQEKELVLSNGHQDGSLPLVYADPALVERILQNLVDNAIKFTPSGGEVVVSAEVVDDDVQIAVQDTGPGILPELKQQLFQKFVTGEQSERGSGLGLAFCRMAVEAHGGQIWVDSSPGKGATFSFTLPIVDRLIG